MGLQNLSNRPLASVLWGIITLIGLVLLGMNIFSWFGVKINGMAIGLMGTLIGLVMFGAGAVSLSDIYAGYR